MGLFTTNAPSAKFAQIGDSVAGVIVDAYQGQRYEYVRGGQGGPLFWHNKKPVENMSIDPATGKPNDPVLQWVLTLDTGQPDEHDNTERRLFIKNKRMDSALKHTVRAVAPREGLLLGGRLRCTWVGQEDGDGPQPANVYEFDYVPPAPGEGREPGGEVRLADREPAFTANPGTPAATTVGGWPQPAYVDAGSRAAALGDWPQPDPALARAASVSAGAGIRDTDVTAGRAAPAAYPDEPPF